MQRLIALPVLSTVATLAAVAAVTPAVATADEGFPLLASGRAAVVAGTPISCTATRTSVTCTKAGGLTVTLLASGAVTVKRGATTRPTSLGKPLVLHNNGGFVNAGTSNSNAYCHVYLASGPTLDCSLTGTGPSGHLTGSHGFDIGVRSVTVFRFDTSTGELIPTKTYPQP